MIHISVWKLARRAVAYEWGMWRSLYRWCRPAAREPGAEAFGYAAAVRPLLVVFIVVSAIEVPVLDLILRHTNVWESVRLAALGGGVYGLFWMVGLLASLQVHPHVVGSSGLRIRSGFSVDVPLPWVDVAGVAGRHRSLESSRTIQVVGEPGHRILIVAVNGQTNVDVTLHEPRVVTLPRGPSEPVTGVRFYADDPDALVARATAVTAVTFTGEKRNS